MKNYDIKGIAEGVVEVDVSSMSPIEAVQLGLAVQNYKDANGIVEDSFKMDYDAIGKILSRNSKLNRENSHIQEDK